MNQDGFQELLRAPRQQFAGHVSEGKTEVEPLLRFFARVKARDGQDTRGMALTNPSYVVERRLVLFAEHNPSDSGHARLAVQRIQATTGKPPEKCITI